MQLTIRYFFIISIVLSIVLAIEPFFEFSANDLNGELIPLSKYKDNKVILVVNVASNCGYTHINYSELQAMYERWHEKGLEILAFPCNQFGQQEQGSSYDIMQYTKRAGVTFPVFEKIDVNGPNAHPIYQHLKKYIDRLEIQWNFTKFLVVDGKPMRKYRTTVSMDIIERDVIGFLEHVEKDASAAEVDGGNSVHNEL